ncbi:unnamed protein product [Microthlaspi erraticum]|uniref:FAE domain-containing protein n=1 Tax=Microthlaspi erraticum TaxID=1685480 RepID=A0A6D2JUF2_9BRAS|nr:unnamed protein product [Microthlaspi erraticum]
MDGARELRIGGGGGGGDGSVQVQNRQTLSVNLKLGYHYLVSNFLILCLLALAVVISVEASQMNQNDLLQLWTHVQSNVVTITICSAVLVSGLTVYVMTRPRPVYMVDSSCYLPPDHLKAPSTMFIDHARQIGYFDDAALEFQRMILERSGLGEETYVCEAMIHVPLRISMAAAREEAEQVMFGALDNLFANTNVDPKDVGILVVNCSIFCPTPSLSQ